MAHYENRGNGTFIFSEGPAFGNGYQSNGYSYNTQTQSQSRHDWSVKFYQLSKSQNQTVNAIYSKIFNKNGNDKDLIAMLKSLQGHKVDRLNGKCFMVNEYDELCISPLCMVDNETLIGVSKLIREKLKSFYVAREAINAAMRDLNVEKVLQKDIENICNDDEIEQIQSAAKSDDYKDEGKENNKKLSQEEMRKQRLIAMNKNLNYKYANSQ